MTLTHRERKKKRRMGLDDILVGIGAMISFPTAAIPTAWSKVAATTTEAKIRLEVHTTEGASAIAIVPTIPVTVPLEENL